MRIRFQPAGFVAAIAMTLAAGATFADNGVVALQSATVATAQTDPALFDPVDNAVTTASEVIMPGSEPDPSFFDSVGLETWWRTYAQKRSGEAPIAQRRDVPRI